MVDVVDLFFDSSLVVMIEDPANHKEVELTLAEKLHALGYVHDSYAEAIIQREQVYPTGLHVGKINVAMPHCDVEHVISGAICVGILGRGVSWRRMDDPEESCEVRLVIMLALNEAHTHLEMLQKVVMLIQDQQLLEEIVSCDDPEEAFSLIAPHLS